MIERIEFQVGLADVATIEKHLRLCDASFQPRLSARVDVSDYARKLMGAAHRFEAWHDGELIGLLALYCDNHPERRSSFITNVSVAPAWQGHGIGSGLLKRCLTWLRALDIHSVQLEVSPESKSALALYAKFGFNQDDAAGNPLKMTLKLQQ